MWYCAANFDERQYPDPLAFRTDRPPAAPHVAFGGGGAHFCLGASLARLEIAELIDEMLDRDLVFTTTGKPEFVEPASIAAWNDAWSQALHFVGDPFATLAPANETDPGFVLGSVFCGTYRVLSGTRPNDPALLDDAARATARAVTINDQGHVQALGHLIDGNFTAAGERWEQLAHAQRDFAAVRFAHDVYLHVGDDARRLRSSQRAFDSWDRADAGWGMIAGQHSFALEEVGRYDEAEQKRFGQHKKAWPCTSGGI